MCDGRLRATKGIGIPPPVDLHRARQGVGPVEAHVSGEEILKARTEGVGEWRWRIRRRMEIVSIVDDGLATPRHHDGIARVESFGRRGRISAIRLMYTLTEDQVARRER